MYWLYIEVGGQVGFISLDERFLDLRLEKCPEEIIFYAEFNTEV